MSTRAALARFSLPTEKHKYHLLLSHALPLPHLPPEHLSWGARTDVRTQRLPIVKTHRYILKIVDKYFSNIC
jgi:hypothetical protein